MATLLPLHDHHSIVTLYCYYISRLLPCTTTTSLDYYIILLPYREHQCPPRALSRNEYTDEAGQEGAGPAYPRSADLKWPGDRRGLGGGRGAGLGDSEGTALTGRGPVASRRPTATTGLCQRTESAPTGQGHTARDKAGTCNGHIRTLKAIQGILSGTLVSRGTQGGTLRSFGGLLRPCGGQQVTHCGRGAGHQL